MSETKKDNGFMRWSKKHAELWKRRTVGKRPCVVVGCRWLERSN